MAADWWGVDEGMRWAVLGAAGFCRIDVGVRDDFGLRDEDGAGGDEAESEGLIVITVVRFPYM